METPHSASGGPFVGAARMRTPVAAIVILVAGFGLALAMEFVDIGGRNYVGAPLLPIAVAAALGRRTAAVGAEWSALTSVRSCWSPPTTRARSDPDPYALALFALWATWGGVTAGRLVTVKPTTAGSVALLAAAAVAFLTGGYLLVYRLRAAVTVELDRITFRGPLRLRSCDLTGVTGIYAVNTSRKAGSVPSLHYVLAGCSAVPVLPGRRWRLADICGLAVALGRELQCIPSPITVKQMLELRRGPLVPGGSGR